MPSVYGWISWMIPKRRLRGNDLQRRKLRTMTNRTSLINLIPRGIHILRTVVGSKATALALESRSLHALAGALLLFPDGLNQDHFAVVSGKHLNKFVEAAVSYLPIPLACDLDGVVVPVIGALQDGEVISMIGESYPKFRIVSALSSRADNHRNLTLLPCLLCAGERGIHFWPNDPGHPRPAFGPAFGTPNYRRYGRCGGPTCSTCINLYAPCRGRSSPTPRPKRADPIPCGSYADHLAPTAARCLAPDPPQAAGSTRRQSPRTLHAIPARRRMESCGMPGHVRRRHR